MSSQFKLTGRKIAITGASSGIGRDIARLVSEYEGDCFLTGRNQPELTETMTHLTGVNHSYHVADLTRSNDREAFVKDCPPIDGLVLCHGMLITKPVGFWSEEKVYEIVNANFTSAFLLVNELIRQKKLLKGGSLVFISSIAGNEIGHPGNSLYAATKGAINAMVNVLALELSKRKIRVNTIMPGIVKTKLWEAGSIDQHQLQEEERRYPLGFGTVQDISHAAIYLLSDASKWMTGSHLRIDGGFTIQ